jgi:hypothetical protein
MKPMLAITMAVPLCWELIKKMQRFKGKHMSENGKRRQRPGCESHEFSNNACYAPCGDPQGIETVRES